MIQLFAAYDPRHIEGVLSPLSGLPAKHKFLPSIAEIREALDEKSAHDKRMEDYSKRYGPDRMLPAPKHEPEVRPTVEQLRAKYGPHFGLHPEKRKKTPFLNADELAHKYGIERSVVDAIPDAKPVPKQLRAKKIMDDVIGSEAVGGKNADMRSVG